MKPSIKIAYILNSLEAGGAQFPVPALFEVMRENGCEPNLFVLSKRSGKAIAAMDAANVPWRCAPAEKTDHIAAARWLVDELREFKPDVIWTSLTQATLLGQWAGKRLGIPVVSWQHNAFLKPANRLLLKWRKDLSEFWVMDSNAVTEFSRSQLGLTDDIMETWPIFRAKPSFPRPRDWQPGEPVRITSLGRLHAAKGYDLLIAAMSRLQQDGFTAESGYYVDIAGEGALQEELEAMAKERGVLNINFIGYRDRPLQFISQSHIYVQPSRREGFCIAAHEAMACGLMPIAGRTGQLAHSIENGVNGRLFTVENTEMLASQLQKTLAAPQTIALMGRKARSDIQSRYSSENFAEAGAHIIGRIHALLADRKNVAGTSR